VAYSQMPDPDLYRRAIRRSIAWWYTIDAAVDGAPVAGATGLRPTGGTIVDTTKAGVRWTLNLELAATPGLYDRLAPEGTTLTATCHVRLTSRTLVDIPMGVYDVESERMSQSDGTLSLTAPDFWSRIQQARFIRPVTSTKGITARAQIALLLGGAVGGLTVNDRATSDVVMGTQTWEKDRDQAVLDVAKSAGVWVFFDRTGVATIVDVPTGGGTAQWYIDSSKNGVLIDLDRERSRAQTRNVVIVESTASGGAKFPTQWVWDNDPTSPTYAGPDPKAHPELAGPFGVAPMYLDDPISSTVLQARTAGYRALYRATGLASQVSLTQVPNPAVDAFDALDVLAKRERYDIPRRVERHVADTITHPLTAAGVQRIEGRSTRAEDITGGS